MSRLLKHLSAFNFLVLLATFAAGWASFLRGSRSNAADPTFLLHIYLGLLAATTTLGLHCLVFIYFLGTGRWVKEVALAYGIADDPLPKLTRDLKRRTFPPALFAMLVVIATSAAGAGVQVQGWHWTVHAGLACATLLINGWAFFVEYRSVCINVTVIDRVLLEVDRIRAERGLPPNEEALREQEAGPA